MGKIPFHYIDLRTFCYATEDEKRVEQAIRSLLPEEFELDRVENTGHHGDRIVIFSARAERADEMRHILGRLSELPDVERVLDELDQRVDDNCSLFLRLDKQSAFKGDVRLGQGITLRAKVEAYPAKRPKAVENARKALREVRAERDDAAAGETTGAEERDSSDEASA